MGNSASKPDSGSTAGGSVTPASPVGTQAPTPAPPTRKGVDPWAPLDSSDGATNADILRAYADTLPSREVQTVMNTAQYQGMAMGAATALATYYYARSRFMRMTFNSSMTAAFAAGLTSSFIFSLTRYYHGLATVREAEEMLQPGWQERYGYRAPVDTPADLEEEWNIWSYFGWKKDAPSTEAENGAGQQPHARGEGHLPPVSGGKSTAEDGEEAGFWSFFGSKKRADPAAQEANAPPPTTENNQPRKA